MNTIIIIITINIGNSSSTKQHQRDWIDLYFLLLVSKQRLASLWNWERERHDKLLVYLCFDGSNIFRLVQRAKFGRGVYRSYNLFLNCATFSSNEQETQRMSRRRKLIWTNLYNSTLSFPLSTALLLPTSVGHLPWGQIDVVFQFTTCSLALPELQWTFALAASSLALVQTSSTRILLSETRDVPTRAPVSNLFEPSFESWLLLTICVCVCVCV